MLFVGQSIAVQTRGGARELRAVVVAVFRIGCTSARGMNTLLTQGICASLTNTGLGRHLPVIGVDRRRGTNETEDQNQRCENRGEERSCPQHRDQSSSSWSSVGTADVPSRAWPVRRLMMIGPPPASA